MYSFIKSRTSTLKIAVKLVFLTGVASSLATLSACGAGSYVAVEVSSPAPNTHVVISSTPAPAKMTVGAIAGVLDSSTVYSDGRVDEYYEVIYSDGEWRGFDYIGDSYDNSYSRCYVLSRGHIVNHEANIFELFYDDNQPSVVFEAFVDRDYPDRYGFSAGQLTMLTEDNYGEVLSYESHYIDVDPSEFRPLCH